VLGTACVIAPVGEEFFFRRILQGWLEKVLSSSSGLPAVGLAAAAFAWAHYGQGLAYVPLFPLGVVLGLLAWRTGSIIPSILLHALFNTVSVTILLAAPPAVG
jgi:membrane protease YdiL (CAAX protease family)